MSYDREFESALARVEHERTLLTDACVDAIVANHGVCPACERAVSHADRWPHARSCDQLREDVSDA